MPAARRLRCRAPARALKTVGGSPAQADEREEGVLVIGDSLDRTRARAGENSRDGASMLIREPGPRKGDLFDRELGARVVDKRITRALERARGEAPELIVERNFTERERGLERATARVVVTRLEGAHRLLAAWSALMPRPITRSLSARSKAGSWRAAWIWRRAEAKASPAAAASTCAPLSVAWAATAREVVAAAATTKSATDAAPSASTASPRPLPRATEGSLRGRRSPAAARGRLARRRRAPWPTGTCPPALARAHACRSLRAHRQWSGRSTEAIRSPPTDPRPPPRRVTAASGMRPVSTPDGGSRRAHRSSHRGLAKPPPLACSGAMKAGRTQDDAHRGGRGDHRLRYEGDATPSTADAAMDGGSFAAAEIALASPQSMICTSP